MSIAEMRVDVEQGVPPTGFKVPRGTALYSRPVDGVSCKFRTCYDTVLWPFTVTSAQWLTPDRLKPAVRLGDAIAALRIELRCLPGVTFSQLDLRTLRVFLSGESNLVYPLYELLASNRRDLIIRETGVNETTIRLGCTPIVNLFPQVAEPLLLTQRRHEYTLVPDAHRRVTTEIFSIDDVVAMDPDSGETQRFEPLYSHRHAANGSGAFWLANRRFSGWRSDVGTDISLSFVDLSGRVVYPEFEVVTARLTCFNSDLPNRLPFGNERGDFELDRGGPVRAIVALVKPTRVVQPPLGSPQIWRLVSQLSLNYLS